MNKKLDHLITHREAQKQGLYKKFHQTVDETATQLELPLQKKPCAPPPFKRLRRRGPQQWLGE